MSEKPIDESSPYNEPFDDGHDWVVKDKKTGVQIARFTDQNKVLPFAYRHGRDTVELEKVKREGKAKMSEQRIVNLSEMMLKVVSEEVLLPKTNDPEKEATELTKNTGLYHYADYDDLIKKPVIVNTNVEAETQNEWLEKAYNSPINEETPVIEPSNFEKNDNYEVTVSDQVAEADEVGPLDWNEMAVGLYKHKYLPLAYDDNSGRVVLYDIDGVSNLNDAEVVGDFDDTNEMDSWIKANINESVAEEYRKLAEVEDAPMAERGVNNNDGDNYGPAPTEDQNDMDFDKEGKFKIDEDEANANLISAAKKAKEESKNGYVQHVDHLGDGHFGVSDWMSDDTVLSYSNGKVLNGNDPLEGEPDSSQSSEMGDDGMTADINFDENLDEARFKPSGSSFESYVDLPDRDDVEVEVHYDIEEDDPSVGYQGGVVITDVCEKGTDHSLMDVISPKDANRLFDEAMQNASGQEGDYADYKYDQMRDDRMEREFGEGKDYRYDPDADDDDMDRQERFKQRKQDKQDRRKDIDEAIGDVERAFMLSVDFTPERLEIDHKGMTDIDSAIVTIADGRPKDKFINEIQMAGLPASFELKRDNSYTLIVLDTNLRNAIESMASMDLCQELLAELEINEDVFYGFLIQGKTGDVMDDSTELAEDELVEAPEFVVSSEHLYADEMAQDPMFIQVMNDAFLTMAEKTGQRVEELNPSIDEVDEIISLGIDNYPNGAKYSFMMSDPMARDAINDAFNILWDEGKINPEHMS